MQKAWSFFMQCLSLCLAFFMLCASFMQIISKGAYKQIESRYNACRRLARRGFSVHVRRIEVVLVHSELTDLIVFRRFRNENRRF